MLLAFSEALNKTIEDHKCLKRNEHAFNFIFEEKYEGDSLIANSVFVKHCGCGPCDDLIKKQDVFGVWGDYWHWYTICISDK